MTRREHFFVFLAVCHIVLVALCAGQVKVDEVPGLSSYAAYSGANTTYGFFAPGVGSQLSLSFRIENKDGQVKADTLQAGMTKESALRISNIIQALGEEVTKPEMRRSMAASWAAKVLARHPGSVSIKVIVQSYDLPSREDFAKGKRPAWVPFYEAKFASKAKERS